MAETSNIQELNISIKADIDSEKINEAADSINHLKSSLVGLGKVSTEKIDALVSSLKGLEKVSLGNLQSLTIVGGSIKNISNSAATASGELKETGKAMGGTVTNGASSASTELAKVNKETKKVGESAKQTTSKWNKFLKSIGRIAMYRLIRSALKAVTSAISDGIKEFYEWSKLYNGKFSQTMDNYATKITELKNSIGSALAPVLESLYPIFEKIVNVIITIVDTLNQLFSALAGSDYWYKATTKVTKYGDAVDKASKSLAGFDEINNIGGTSSSSDSGSATSTDYVQQEYSSWAKVIKDISQKIKDFLGLTDDENGSLGKLATALGIAYLAAKLLNNIFGRKNTTLSKQTTLTDTETESVGELANGFNLAYLTSGLLLVGLAALLKKLLEGQNNGEDWNWGLDLDTVPAYDSLGELEGDLGQLQLPALSLDLNIQTALDKLGEFVNGFGTMTSEVEETNTSTQNNLESSWEATAKRLTLQEENYGNEINKNVANQGIAAQTSTAGTYKGIEDNALESYSKMLSDETTFGNSLNKNITSQGIAAQNSTAGTYSELEETARTSYSNLSDQHYDFEVEQNKVLNEYNSSNSKSISDLFKDIGITTDDGLLAQHTKTSATLGTITGLLATYSSDTLTGLGNLGASATQATDEEGNGMIESNRTSLSQMYDDVCSYIRERLAALASMTVGTLNYNGSSKKSTNFVSTAVTAAAAAVAAFRAKHNGFGFATGGVVTRPTYGLVGEYSGAKNNPEIISPRNIMLDTMYEANGNVQESLYDVAGIIVNAINDKDMNTYIDGNEIGKASVKYINKQSRLRGASII